MPNLVILPGAPKSGTTSLLTSIANTVAEGGQSPDYVKEPGYLLREPKSLFQAKRTIATGSAYERSLLSYRGWLFDATQAYFTCALDKRKIQRLRSNYRSIHLIFLLRDPYARIQSSYRMDLANGWIRGDLRTYLQEELDGVNYEYGAGPRYIQESLYAQRISAVCEAIQPTSVHVILTEELSPACLNEVLGNIGAPIFVDHISHSNISNSDAPPRWLKPIKELLPIRLRRKYSESAWKMKLRRLLYQKIKRTSLGAECFPIGLIEEDIAALDEHLNPYQARLAAMWHRQTSGSQDRRREDRVSHAL